MTPKYRYDNLQFSTLLPNFTNIGTVTGSISASGTIADGSGANFSTSLTLASANTYSDVYAINQSTLLKTLLNNNSAIAPIWQYDSFSGETLQNTVSYSGSVVTVTFNVSNTSGRSITLTNQTYTIEVTEYQLPI